MNIQAKKIAAFIDQHDMPVKTRVNADGTLQVFCNEFDTSTRELKIVEYTIQANMQAARDILGY